MKQRDKLRCILMLFGIFFSIESYAQDDSLYNNIFGKALKFDFEYYNFKGVASNLKFSYHSSNNIIIDRNLNLTKISKTFSLGIGGEKNFSNKLYVDFLNMSFSGLFNNFTNVHVANGIGYLFAFGKDYSLQIRPNLQVFYSIASYNMGSYSDTTNKGIVVNNQNIGASARISYQNKTFGFIPNINFVYKGSGLGYFLNLGFNQLINSTENIAFFVGKGRTYNQKLANSTVLTDGNGNVVNKNIVTSSQFFIRVGISLSI